MRPTAVADSSSRSSPRPQAHGVRRTQPQHRVAIRSSAQHESQVGRHVAAVGGGGHGAGVLAVHGRRATAQRALGRTDLPVLCRELPPLGCMIPFSQRLPCGTIEHGCCRRGEAAPAPQREPRPRHLCLTLTFSCRARSRSLFLLQSAHSHGCELRAELVVVVRRCTHRHRLCLWPRSPARTFAEPVEAGATLP